jgi:hypothetical protein
LFKKPKLAKTDCRPILNNLRHYRPNIAELSPRVSRVAGDHYRSQSLTASRFAPLSPSPTNCELINDIWDESTKGPTFPKSREQKVPGERSQEQGCNESGFCRVRVKSSRYRVRVKSESGTCGLESESGEIVLESESSPSHAKRHSSPRLNCSTLR